MASDFVLAASTTTVWLVMIPVLSSRDVGEIMIYKKVSYSTSYCLLLPYPAQEYYASEE